jgi:hypothetical protein
MPAVSVASPPQRNYCGIVEALASGYKSRGNGRTGRTGTVPVFLSSPLASRDGFHPRRAERQWPTAQPGGASRGKQVAFAPALAFRDRRFTRVKPVVAILPGERHFPLKMSN